MELASTPRPLECAECGEEIAEAGYLPAVEREEAYEPIADGAVCADCGFNAIGTSGCAPEPDDVIDPGPDDVLLYVRRADDGFDVLRTKA